MKTPQISLTTQEKRPAKTRKQSFLSMNIGTPKVPFRKHDKKIQEHELLSDWEHAS
ncbi:hypothetical protein [Nostoc sp. WHI]|uniref:hypothetical protein n=1 Tax=Nostoc sp. WHI TaxID=2650611 RepID=UPI0018C45185|nr:hypothetical protein [Nostoc sp. WHI]